MEGFTIVSEDSIRQQVAADVVNQFEDDQKKARAGIADAMKKKAAAEDALRGYYRKTSGSGGSQTQQQQQQTPAEKQKKLKELDALRAAVTSASKELQAAHSLLETIVKARKEQEKNKKKNLTDGAAAASSSSSVPAITATPQQLQALHQRATGDTLLVPNRRLGNNNSMRNNNDDDDDDDPFQTPAPVVAPGGGLTPSGSQTLAAEYSGGALVPPATRVLADRMTDASLLGDGSGRKPKTKRAPSGKGKDSASSRRVKKEASSSSSSSSSDDDDDDDDTPLMNRLRRNNKNKSAVRRSRRDETKVTVGGRRRRRGPRHHSGVERFTISDDDADYTSSSSSGSDDNDDDDDDDDSEDLNYEASFSDDDDEDSSSGSSDEDDDEVRPRQEDLVPVSIDRQNCPGYVVPTYVWNALLEYQKDALRWFAGLHRRGVGGILGDDLGLGKTVQTAAFIHTLHASGKLHGPVLILAPLTVLAQWRREMRKWCQPLPVVILHSMELGGATMRGAITGKVKGKHVVALSTYASFQRNVTVFAQAGFDYAVLDEGHKISNPEAGVTVAVKSMPTTNRFILSGSPIQNSLLELWSLFDFCCPGLLGGAVSFVTAFDDPIKASRNPHATPLQLATAVECAKALRTQIGPYLLRRLKKDVNRMLPPKLEKAVMCPLTDKQLQTYVNVLSSTEVNSVNRHYQNVNDELRTLDKHGREMTRGGGGGGLNMTGVNKRNPGGALRTVMQRMWEIMADLRSICNHNDIFTVRSARREEKKKEKVQSGLLGIAGGAAVNTQTKSISTDKKKARFVDDDTGNPFALAVDDDDAAGVVGSDDDDDNDSADNARGKKKNAKGKKKGSGAVPARGAGGGSNKSISFRSNKPVDLEGSSKLIALAGLMADWIANGHKALVFTQTRMMLDIIENLVSQRGYTYIRLDGTTPGQQRHELVHRFNQDPTIFCALLTTRVGGLGLNLTGADRVVLFDPDFNPTIDEQARERAWRIGQTREVHVYRLITSGTVEEHILHRQLAKMFVTEKVLSDPSLQRFFSIHNFTDAFRLGSEYTERVAKCCHGDIVSEAVTIRPSIQSEISNAAPSGLNLVKQEPLAEVKQEHVQQQQHNFDDDDDDDDDDDPFQPSRRQQKKKNTLQRSQSQSVRTASVKKEPSDPFEQQHLLQQQRSPSRRSVSTAASSSQPTSSSSSMMLTPATSKIARGIRVVDSQEVMPAMGRNSSSSVGGGGLDDDDGNTDDTGTGLLGVMIDGKTNTQTMRRAASSSQAAQQLATLSALTKLKTVLSVQQKQLQEDAGGADQKQQQPSRSKSQQEQGKKKPR